MNINGLLRDLKVNPHKEVRLVNGIKETKAKLIKAFLVKEIKANLNTHSKVFSVKVDPIMQDTINQMPSVIPQSIMLKTNPITNLKTLKEVKLGIGIKEETI